MRNRNGFSLVEMEISIVIAAILVLTVGAMSQVGLVEHSRYQKESALYGDIAYAFRLIQNKGRAASEMSVQSTSAWLCGGSFSGTWTWVTGSILRVNNSSLFGICLDSVSGTKYLTYMQDANTIDRILKVPSDGNITMTFSDCFNSNVPIAPTSCTAPSVNLKSIIVTLAGNKDNISIEPAATGMSTTIFRRGL